MLDKFKNWVYSYAHTFDAVGWIAVILVTVFLFWNT